LNLRPRKNSETTKGDRLILLDVEFEKTKITSNFSSNSTLKEVKQSIKKQMFTINNKNHDNYLIKIYINGKEIKDENVPIGSIIDGDKGDMLMACLTLTDEILNDEKKIYENLIENLSKNCLIHNDKASNICLNCGNSICDKCFINHSNHKIISKKEIINYENNLTEILNFFDEKFEDMKMSSSTNKNNNSNKNISNSKEKINTYKNEKETFINESNCYQEFYVNLRHEISKQCDMIFSLVEEIKKKEIQLLNNFKLDLDPILPNILDYKDKIKNLLFQIKENKKERILRNDSDFIEFYLKYLQLQNINEKFKQNLIYIKCSVDKYREIINDFKFQNDQIIKDITKNIDKIRGYDIKTGSPQRGIILNNLNNENLQTFNSNLYNINNINNFKNENLYGFNSVSKNEFNDINNFDINLANFNSHNSNHNKDIIDKRRAYTPISSHKNISRSNNKDMNCKNKNDYQGNNNNFNNLHINGNNSFHFSHNNFPNNSKLNLINLLGSSGKSKNTLIRSFKKTNDSKSQTNIYQSSKNFSNNNNNNHIENINLLSNVNYKDNIKSFNIQIEEESSVNLPNDIKDDMFIIQSKIITTQINTRSILVFDNITNSITKQEIDFSKVSINKFESNQSTLNYNNKFYISGGSGFYSANSFFELDTENYELKPQTNMLFKHPFHSLIGSKNLIFAISGFNSKKVEKFDLKNLAWSELPELNEARSFPNCIFFENKYIYVFGGLIESLNKSNSYVERINLDNSHGNLAWEKLEICFSSNSEQENNTLSIPFYSGLIRTSKDKFLLLGGKQDKELFSSLNVFFFNLKENTFEENNELSLPSIDEFQGKNFLKFEENKYAQFSALNSNKIFIYDENENKFNLIEYKE